MSAGEPQPRAYNIRCSEKIKLTLNLCACGEQARFRNLRLLHEFLNHSPLRILRGSVAGTRCQRRFGDRAAACSVMPQFDA